MFVSETQLRVRYAETDKMGYVYYGKYAEYYEIGRTDSIRKFGMTYRRMEDEGIILPVLSFSCKYIRPAYYDDLLTVRTMIKEKPETRLKFEYEIINEQGELINVGETVLVFVDAAARRPRKAPDDFLQQLNQYFDK